MSARVEVSSVRKSFGRLPVLHGIDFSVAAGEIVGLLGPNGSGKTTCLRIIAGFLAADSGTVRICGDLVGPGSRGVRAHIGYLPERPPLYDPLTVGEYLDFVAAAKAIGRPLRRRAIDLAVEAFELGRVRGKVIGHLSKGFRQRVGLAQATIGQPDVLLLDEATSGLDPLQIVETRRMIRDGSADRGVIFSSHIMQDIAALCDRVLVIHAGRVIELPRPEHDGAPLALEIVLRGIDAAAARTLLAAVPGVAAVTLRAAGPGEARLLVTAAAGADPREPLIDAVKGKAALLALVPQRASLEERFVAGIAASVPPAA